MGLLPEGVRTTGSVRLAGVDHDLVGADERQMSRVRGRDVAMVFQEPMTALNPTMRVGDQVAEVMLLHGTRPDRRSARAAAVELLDQVGLPDPGDAARAYPHQLSGGQRQRVILAMALANDPALLVCDEPTTALDVTVQALVLDLIVRGVAARDAALLFITHDLAVVATRLPAGAGDVRRPRRRGGSGRARCSPGRGTATPRACSAPPTSTSSTSAAGSSRSPAPCPAPGGSRPGACSATGARTPRRPASRPRRGPGRTQPPASPATTRPARPPTARWGPVADQPLALRVRDVTRDYTRPRTSLRRPGPVVHALRGVSFDVAPGERFGIVGESGCGKSTLLRILAGLDRPTSGSVEVDGTDIAGLPERRLRFLRERLQLVFQDPMSSLDPRMRVRDIIAEPLVAQGHPAHGERVAELLQAVGLPAEAAGRYPHQFSGGQRQRISIARALAPRPGILVADEPVSALDVSVRAQVLNLVTDLVAELSLTLVFVSHDLSVVRRVCDRVAVMHEGRIVETGTTDEVYENPQHPYTQRLVAAVPTLARPSPASAPPTWPPPPSPGRTDRDEHQPDRRRPQRGRGGGRRLHPGAGAAPQRQRPRPRRPARRRPPSSSPTGCAPCGWEPQVVEVAPGRPNVVRRRRRRRRPRPDADVRGPHRRRHRGRPVARGRSTRSAPRSATAACTAGAAPT